MRCARAPPVNGHEDIDTVIDCASRTREVGPPTPTVRRGQLGRSALDARKMAKTCRGFRIEGDGTIRGNGMRGVRSFGDCSRRSGGERAIRGRGREHQGNVIRRLHRDSIPSAPAATAVLDYYRLPSARRASGEDARRCRCCHEGRHDSYRTRRKLLEGVAAGPQDAR